MARSVTFRRDDERALIRFGPKVKELGVGAASSRTIHIKFISDLTSLRQRGESGSLRRLVGYVCYPRVSSLRQMFDFAPGAFLCFSSPLRVNVYLSIEKCLR